MYIPVILGTAREGRKSENVAKYVVEEVKAAGIDTELLDVRDYRLPATNKNVDTPQAKKLSAIISKADGLIVVTPEYNHGYPGELKMMIDMLRDEYAKKPVGLCGVSAGPLGGARVVDLIKPVFVELHMTNIREALYFPLVDSLFDDKGVLKDKKAYAPRVKAFLEELVWYAQALNKART
jgi:NAD(P)H-dependent FMN reductase